jgi:hypothetical protein
MLEIAGMRKPDSVASPMRFEAAGRSVKVTDE